MSDEIPKKPTLSHIPQDDLQSVKVHPIIEMVLDQIRFVRKAPIPYASAVIGIAITIYAVMQWGYSTVIETQKTQIEELKTKLTLSPKILAPEKAGQAPAPAAPIDEPYNVSDPPYKNIYVVHPQKPWRWYTPGEKTDILDFIERALSKIKEINDESEPLKKEVPPGYEFYEGMMGDIPFPTVNPKLLDKLPDLQTALSAEIDKTRQCAKDFRLADTAFYDDYKTEIDHIFCSSLPASPQTSADAAFQKITTAQTELMKAAQAKPINYQVLRQIMEEVNEGNQQMYGSISSIGRWAYQMNERLYAWRSELRRQAYGTAEFIPY